MNGTIRERLRYPIKEWSGTDMLLSTINAITISPELDLMISFSNGTEFLARTEDIHGEYWEIFTPDEMVLVASYGPMVRYISAYSEID